MKLIRLYRGQMCRVDDEDFDVLSRFRWHMSSWGYVRRYRRRSERGTSWYVFMHRQITEAPDGLEVDHINGDRCDNRRCNLRLASHSQNCRNQRIGKKNTTGFKGVTKTRGGRFVAQINYNRTGHNLGTYSTAEEAAAVYAREARKQFGEFANVDGVFADTFALPSPEDIEGVTAGSLVKVCGDAERFWVQVYSRRGNILRGRVDSPTLLSHAEYDDVIEFHCDNIYEVYLPCVTR